MIKVTFVYKTKTEHLDELMQKFKESSHEKFKSDPSNLSISMYSKEENDYTIINLDIFYNSIDDYRKRTEFELSQPDWNEIWFSNAIKHEQVSVEVYNVLKK